MFTRERPQLFFAILFGNFDKWRMLLFVAFEILNNLYCSHMNEAIAEAKVTLSGLNSSCYDATD